MGTVLGHEKGGNGEERRVGETRVERMAKMNRRRRRENRTLSSHFSALLFGLLAVHKIDMCIEMNRQILDLLSHTSQKHLYFQSVPPENTG